MTYELSLDLTYNIDINNILGCVSSLFSVETSNLPKGIYMIHFMGTDHTIQTAKVLVE